MPQHPLLNQLKTMPNLFAEKRKDAGLAAIDYYANMHSATESLNSVLKVIDKLYQLKLDGQVLNSKGYLDLDADIAFFSILKTVFYSMEKGYANLTDLPQLSGDIVKDTKLLNDWSDSNIEKINKTLK